MPTLYDFQQIAVDAVKAAIDRRCILVSPTGSGKSVMLARIIADLNVPTLILAHRRELTAQLAGHLRTAGLPVGIIQAGFSENRALPFQVASVQTLARRDLPEANLVVLDECHHGSSPSIRALLESYPDAWRLGATATPFRLDGKGLGAVFSTLVVAATVNQLVERGLFVAPVVFAPAAPDMRGVSIVGGDYNERQSAERMDRPSVTGDIVEHWSRLASGKRTIAFAVNVQHSIHIRDRFLEAGIPAEHLDGSSSAIERAAVLHRLREGQTKVLTNCALVNEGFDLPALECAIIARPTASLAWHLQAIGRIVRASDEKTSCICADHAGNHLRHGMVTKDIAYSLEDKPKPRKADFGEPPVKTCPECYLICELWAAECPKCGYVWPQKGRGKIREVSGELVDFSDKAAAYERLVAQQQAYQFKPGWIAVRFHEMYGEWPTSHDGALVDPAKAPEDAKVAELKRLLDVANRKQFQVGWAAHAYRGKFGVFPNGDIKRAAGYPLSEKRWPYR